MVFIFALAFPVAAAEKPAKEADKSLPIEAVLVAKKSTYTLDLGDKTAKEYRRKIEADAARDAFPNPPVVDLVLELRNTSDKEVKVQVGGTLNTLMLKLSGPGALEFALRNRITPKFVIAPRTVMLAPGKSVTAMTIKTLSYGYRGIGNRAYWTAPGEYTLKASYQTAISPPPQGTKADPKGFAPVTVTGAPVKIKVETK
jgi:hypothetical protein